MRSSKATRPESLRLSGDFSIKERNALVAEYRESQMSVKAFSQIKGINPWSLKYWIKTKSKPKIPRNKAKWVEVIVEQKKTEDLQIHIGRHCQVQIREVGQIELAAALIQRMEQGV